MRGLLLLAAVQGLEVGRRRALLVGGAVGASSRAASASAAPRYVEERVPSLSVPGTLEKVQRWTGEGTGMDLSRRAELPLFTDEAIADWPDSAPWSTDDFRRLDESDDSFFYPEQAPKLVYHVDEGAVAALTNYYRQRIAPGSDILDICSSWVSHYPFDFPSRMKSIVGTGMNARELSANTQLSSFVAVDLNQSPKLPFADGTFDVVTCVVSVDYLTKPLQVLAEVRRVLRPGGVVIFSQSNRVFFTKAIRMWLSMGDEAHLELIGQYLKYAGFSKRPRAFDISAKGRGAKDPMYIVECEK